MVARSDASTIETGSSATISCGCSSSARATMTRWRWPPLKLVRETAEDLLGAQADARSASLDQVACFCPRLGEAEFAHRRREHVVHAIERIVDARTGPGRPPARRDGTSRRSARGECVQVAAVVEHLPDRRRDQAEQQPRERRLAAAAFADDGGDRGLRQSRSRTRTARARRCVRDAQPAAEDLGHAARQLRHAATRHAKMAAARMRGAHVRAAPAARRGSGRPPADSADGRRSRAASRAAAARGRECRCIMPFALERRQAGDQHPRVGMPRRGDDLARSARSRPGGRRT